MAATPLPSLQKITLPSTIDLSSGAQVVNVDTVIDAGGLSVPGLYLYFSQSVAFSTPGYQVASNAFIAAGDLNLRWLGATDDTFHDATPASARSTFTLSPLTSPGMYKLVGAYLGHDATPGIQHDDGFYPTGTYYDSEQLHALGLDLAFTVVNNAAPPAPTEALITNTPGFFATGPMRIGGTAKAGTTVTVEGLDADHGSIIRFGTAQTDANGKWTLTSQALANGSYTHVVAKAVDAAGNASMPSAETSFVIGGRTFALGDGKAGNNVIQGSAGVDTVVVDAPRAGFTVQHTDTGHTVTDKSGKTGVNTLTGIERIVFSDGSVALDTAGHGGQAYRLYQAAFDRAPDATGNGYWIGRLDAGLSLRDVAGEFIQSAEFAALYGASPSDQAFVTALYDNVLHRAFDQDGFDFWTRSLAAGMSREDVLVQFSESGENQAQVIGTIQDGFLFTPYQG